MGAQVGGRAGGRAIEAGAAARKPAVEAAAGSRAPACPASWIVISKPGIAAGVALAGAAGMALGGRGMPPAGTAFACVGSIVAAAAGAAILNGILDAPLDARMPRLSARVAAMRSVGTRPALVLALLLVAAGLVVAFAFLNAAAAALVLAAVLGYVVLYTLHFKRRSPYGTIPGGIPGALPILIGYVSAAPRPGVDAFLLFLVMVMWQPPHFWSLALKYQDDYRGAGIPVLPAAFGESYTRTLMFVYAAALLPLSLGLWALGPCSGSFALASAALWVYFVASLYAHAVRSRRFGRAFGASILYILLLLVAVIVDLAV